MIKNTMTNDGGSAFPVSTGSGPLSANFVSSGMSLRDWFAGMALQGLLAYPDSGDCSKLVFAKDAYIYADAMLKEREKHDR